jgi:hypothetical protein
MPDIRERWRTSFIDAEAMRIDGLRKRDSAQHELRERRRGG